VVEIPPGLFPPLAVSVCNDFVKLRADEVRPLTPGRGGCYNTVANYDPEIIPFLDAPPGSAFARDRRTGKFVAEAFNAPED
jgi:hypothetical protein